MNRFFKQLTWTSLTGTICGLALTGAAFAAQTSYTVQPGDTYWTISQQTGVSIATLEAANPSIPAWNLQPYETVDLSSTAAGSGTSTYTVQAGDTFWRIANQFSISVSALEQANASIPADNLQTGQVLSIPSSSTSSSTGTDTSSTGSGTAPVATGSDAYWMAHLIAAEADGQPTDAKLAVGAVVMNRTHAQGFASTVQGVIFQTLNGHAQFTCVANGWIYNVQPSAQDIQIANQVLQGTDILPGALVFYNPAQTPSGSWVWSQPVLASYGNLTFAS